MGLGHKRDSGGHVRPILDPQPDQQQILTWRLVPFDCSGTNSHLAEETVGPDGNIGFQSWEIWLTSIFADSGQSEKIP
jgi:hypothetical protein